jgi:hypothetical protein
MIKMTKLGEWQNIHQYTGKILESYGYHLEEIENGTAKNFMLKSVLAMGDIDIELLKEILSKVRSLIYIGESWDVKEAIAQFCIEKDIPEAMNKITFTSEVIVYRNNLKTIQIYSSHVFSEMELASKYMAYNGTKIVNLIKYVSQIELQRTSAPFDAELDEIKGMYNAFIDYYHECEETKLDPDKLIQIYETHKPQ